MPIRLYIHGVSGWKFDKDIISTIVMVHPTPNLTAITIKSISAILLVVCLTAWAVLAIYYGDSTTGHKQTILAILFGLVGFAVMLGVCFSYWRSRLLAAFVIMFALVVMWWFRIEPSNYRNWQIEVARLPYSTIDGDLVTVHNVRNFSYRTETNFTPDYYTRTYDLSKLDSVDIFASYWMGPAIAHTIISFGFAGQDYLAVSIEARKEQEEGYSTIKGFFRQYELIYVLADERDVIRLRTNIRNSPPEQVYRYRLQGTPENARRFFLEYIKAVNELNKYPRFYNTLTENCTNVIWMNAKFNPERIPFSWKILASGYAPEYLYDMKLLDTSVSFAELSRRGHVNAIANSLGDDPDFSQHIRHAAPKAN